MNIQNKSKEYTLGRLQAFLSRFEHSPITPGDISEALAKEIDDAYLAGYYNGIADAHRKETPEVQRYENQVN